MGVGGQKRILFQGSLVLGISSVRFSGEKVVCGSWGNSGKKGQAAYLLRKETWMVEEQTLNNLSGRR